MTLLEEADRGGVGEKVDYERNVRDSVLKSPCRQGSDCSGGSLPELHYYQ